MVSPHLPDATKPTPNAQRPTSNVQRPTPNPSTFQPFNLIKEIMHSDILFITDEQRLRPKDSEVFRLKGDNRLLKELTGWQPEYSLEQGLNEIIAWFRNPEKIQTRTLQSVNHFSPTTTNKEQRTKNKEQRTTINWFRNPETLKNYKPGLYNL